MSRMVHKQITDPATLARFARLVGRDIVAAVQEVGAARVMDTHGLTYTLYENDTEWSAHRRGHDGDKGEHGGPSTDWGVFACESPFGELEWAYNLLRDALRVEVKGETFRDCVVRSAEYIRESMVVRLAGRD